MPRPSRRLLFLPFLLLVPLGVLKWRADHPPVTVEGETSTTIRVG